MCKSSTKSVHDMISKWYKLRIQTYANVYVRRQGWWVIHVYAFSCSSEIAESENSHVHLMRNIFNYLSAALVRACLCIRLCTFSVKFWQFSAMKSVECMWTWTDWSMQPFITKREMERFISYESACGFRHSLDVSSIIRVRIFNWDVSDG